MSCAKNSYWNLKVMQKNSDFQANYELYQGFLLRFKSDAENSDFQVNYELC